MQENKLNKIPRILLGTSPFIGAAQFGEKAREYRKNLYENPEHMATIIVESAHQGINAIQALAYPPIMEAIKMAQSEVETPISI
ncbi:MAG: hypothetical protein SVW57_08305, partial [Thermodesulfobacteriota bacterium]|nr:hypothetical protein [Thermodesulfobacteriota bacterium]